MLILFSIFVVRLNLLGENYLHLNFYKLCLSKPTLNILIFVVGAGGTQNITIGKQYRFNKLILLTALTHVHIINFNITSACDFIIVRIKISNAMSNLDYAITLVKK